MSTILDTSRQLPLAGGTVYYQDDFLTSDEASLLYEHLRDTADWEQRSITFADKVVLQPRLIAWYGDKPYTYSRTTFKPKPMPDELLNLRLKIDEALAVFHRPLNSCLVNYYRNGSDSIGFHADDEPELGREPLIASISLGQEREFQFKHKFEKITHKLLLNHGSLLIMSGKTQQNWNHGMNKIKNDPELIKGRINITFRQII